MLKSLKLLNKYGVRVSVLETLLAHVCDFKETDYVNHSVTCGTSHAFRVLFYVLAHNSHRHNMGAAISGALVEAAKYHALGWNPNDPGSDYGMESFKRMQEIDAWGTDCMLYTIASRELEAKELVRYIVENHCKSENDAYGNVELYPLLLPHKEMAFDLMRIFRDSVILAKGELTDADRDTLQVDYSYQLAYISGHVYTTLLP